MYIILHYYEKNSTQNDWAIVHNTALEQQCSSVLLLFASIDMYSWNEQMLQST